MSVSRATQTFLAVLLMVSASAEADNQIDSIPIVDTHVHLWDLKRPAGIYWISKDDPFLYRSFLPAVHEPIAAANNVQGVVVVQAGQSLPDNQWNLDITAHNQQFYRGVVGNLSEVIGTDQFKPLFERLCKDPRYVGYRLSGRYQEQLTDAFYRDLQLTADKGKTVDFLLGKFDLDDVAQIARRVPNLKIILDHFGNVRLNDRPLDQQWVNKMRDVAKHKRVHCKVSAFYGRTKEKPAPSDIRFYKPVLDLVFDCFGEDRLVYGIDWPVTRSSGDYASVVKLTKAYFDAKGREVSEKLFYRNAARFYGIDEPQRNANDWLPKVVYTKPGISFRSIVVIDRNTILVGGSSGLLMRSTDRGQSWVRVGVAKDSENLDFRDLQFTGKGNVVLMSAGPGDKSRIYQSADNGKNMDAPASESDCRRFFQWNGVLVRWDRPDGWRSD